MVDVALINPGPEATYPHPPLNLGFIASYLEKYGVSVVIIDEQVGQKVERELKRHAPRIVGITATTQVVPYAYRIADFVKENLNALTVMGGVHATIMTDEALQHVDVVVRGEGERAMLDLFKNGASSKVISGPFIENLDEIPIPARHLMNMSFYLAKKEKIGGKDVKKVGASITSRGCPYRCIFCYNAWRDTPVRFHSAEYVTEELKHLVEVYGVEYFLFHDDSFTANKKRLRRICELMIENNLSEFPWHCSTRADLVDLETLKMMRKAGCVQIFFGFESGSQRILDILKKKTSVEENKKAIRLCKEAGIRVRGNFMIGNPTETFADIKMTERFIEENDIDETSITITTPFPGTELWNWGRERGLIPEKVDYSIFTSGPESITASDKISKDDLHAIYLKLMTKCEIKNYGKIGLIKQIIKKPRIAFKYARAAIKQLKSS